MSERKVINKYYPPDYDPSKVPRVKKKTKQNDVRVMAPFNMKCNTCGNYIATATKFNAKKEVVEDKTYNNLLIFRFYIKCPRCMAPITFRTNPKEGSYEAEHGVTENFMAAKMAERQARDVAEAEEEEEKINPMKSLEKRTKASKLQMEASDHIQNLRAIKQQQRQANLDSLIESKRLEAEEEKVSNSKADDDIAKEAQRILNRQAAQQSVGCSSTLITKLPTHLNSSKRPSSSSLDNLRKKSFKIVQKKP